MKIVEVIADHNLINTNLVIGVALAGLIVTAYL